jgi:hypothetical protein
MRFQQTFLGYYPIKSQQLKKQTHSVKMRNWSHRERTAPDGCRRRTASGRRRLWTAFGRRGSRPPLSDGPGDWRTATPSGGRRAIGRDVITDVFGRKCPSGHPFRPDVRPCPHLPADALASARTRKK